MRMAARLARDPVVPRICCTRKKTGQQAGISISRKFPKARRALTSFSIQCSNDGVSAPQLQQLYRKLPSVDQLLGRPRVASLLRDHAHDLVVEEIRAVLEETRSAMDSGTWDNGAGSGDAGAVRDLVEERVVERLAKLSEPSLRKVINATGVILHTNLGRAPLSENVVEAIRRTAGGYTNLEYDLGSGRRGKRDIHAGALLQRLLGAPAIVVNNNAAAVFLVLNELAGDGEVLVSRGELIEIGDGFRIPDIMARSGAKLREIGATNRTHIDDYRSAVSEQTRLLLRVHRSNFRMVGFTSRPSLQELVALGRETGLPVVEDLGSGCLYDFTKAGFEEEPPVSASLRAGADLVTFSGDKLLGGPQAGIIAGSEEWVRRVRRNPLFRALRVDKLTYAALEATLADYLFGRFDQIPVLRMVRETGEQLAERARRVGEGLGPGHRDRWELTPGQSVLGGGSTPQQTLPTTLISVRPVSGRSIAILENELRLADPPVIARCENDRLLLDLRTVLREEEDALIEILQAVL